MQLIKRFLKEEDGQDMVEYGLVIALIALAAIVGVTAFGTSLNTGFNTLATTLGGKL